MNRRPGLMLIEVLAALVLLGGAVVGMLVAQGRCLRQLDDARRKGTAAHLASELLDHWQLHDDVALVSDEGVFEGHPQWSWRRTAQATTVAETVEMTRVVLEIFQRPTDANRQLAIVYQWLEIPVDGDPQ